MENLLQAISANPITAGVVGTALAAVAAFFRPIMRALQAALVRRINQAWLDESEAADCSVDERVRRTADRVRSQTLMPLSQDFVEARVRKAVSESEPPEPS